MLCSLANQAQFSIFIKRKVRFLSVLQAVFRGLSRSDVTWRQAHFNKLNTHSSHSWEIIFLFSRIWAPPVKRKPLFPLWKCKCTTICWAPFEEITLRIGCCHTLMGRKFKGRKENIFLTLAVSKPFSLPKWRAGFCVQRSCGFHGVLSPADGRMSFSVKIGNDSFYTCRNIWAVLMEMGAMMQISVWMTLE